ncbi:MAG: hypothetical protein ACOC8B_06360, partial [Gemmatimonadota bacterium]
MHAYGVVRPALAIAIVAVVAACAGPQRVTAQESPFWTALSPGEYDTGFRRVWTLDVTRVWPRSPALDSLGGTIARPVRVDVWYPARCGDAGRMPVRDYVEIDPPDSRYDDMVSVLHAWDDYSYRGLAGDSAGFERLMAAPTAACRDASPAGGRFPLVVYSAGWFNRSPDNTILAEFLASHGFVVAAVPQLNPGLWTYDFRSDPASIENQIRDLEVALSRLIGAADVDRRRIAAMGYSTGGDVALLLQGRNPHVDAVVGLDASWTIGSVDDVLSSPYFGPERNRAPILALRRPTDGGVDGPNVPLDSLATTPRLIVEVPGGEHGTFSDDPAQRHYLGTGPGEHVASHAAVARAVLDFLNAPIGETGALDGGRLVETYR